MTTLNIQSNSNPRTGPKNRPDGKAPRPLCCTIQKAAELIGVSEDTVRRRISDGSLRARKVVGRILIDFADLERLAGIDQ